MGLKIALDYDGTYTADTLLWDEFMKLARSRGHEVILTSNKKGADLSKDVALKEIAKIAAGLILGKKAEAKKNHGIEFDIWIDNGNDHRSEGEDNGKDRPIEPSNGGVEEIGVVGQEAITGSSAGEADERVNAPVPTPKRRGRVARPKS